MSDEDLKLNELDATADDGDAPDGSAPPASPPETAASEPAKGGGRTDDMPTHGASELEAVFDIPVQLSAVLGRSTMQVSQLLKLGRGAVVELDRKVGEAIDIYVNNRLVARGEIVVVDDRLGVTMTEIIKSDRH
ncbi:MAG: flagellar motor switch protein FliN [Alphaproteobacteria bacterium]